MKKLIAFWALISFALIVYSQSSRTDYLNVKDYGAVGNGIIDDRASIQSALDDGYIQHKAVYIPSGIYLTSTTSGKNSYANLFIKPGVVFYGDGDASVIQRAGGIDVRGYAIQYDAITNDGVNISLRNYILKNFKIIGTTIGRGYEVPGSTNIDGGIFLGFNGKRMNKVLIEGVTVESVNKEAIAVWDAAECVMRNNKVINCNHDAYNPSVIGTLIMQNNFANGANFDIEYAGTQTLSVPTYALIEGNTFINTYEYGISIAAGDNIKISNNIISGYYGTTTITGQSIGIFLFPHIGLIDKIEISNNQINNFVNGGIDNSNSYLTDYVIQHLIIKDNIIFNSGQCAIRLAPFNKTKIVNTSISGNTIFDWGDLIDSNSFQFCAIALTNINSVSISNNRFYSKYTRRRDPLYVNMCSNVNFINNDVTGLPSEYSTYLTIRKSGTNTNINVEGNQGLVY